MNKFLRMTSFVLVMLAAMLSVAKADYCEKAVTNAVNQELSAQYGAQTAEIRDAMAFLESQGKTNGPLYQSLSQALNNANGQLQNLGQQAVQKGVGDCRSNIAPVQNIVDGSVAYFTGGLSLVLPKQMTHIDMGEVLSGNILGGDNSFFRKNLGIKW